MDALRPRLDCHIFPFPRTAEIRARLHERHYRERSPDTLPVSERS